ncbi:MAG: Mitochondrial chaperone Frataxin [Geoglossum umbratile]|nr:MAG: Mitochondrial chaperone Frataxin [Geoglossum umbratile]
MLRLAQRLVRGGGPARQSSFIAAGHRALAPTTARAASSFAPARYVSIPQAPTTHRKSIHTTPTTSRAITPDSSTPPAPSTTPSHIAAPANISIEEYHDLADRFLDSLVVKLEGLSEQRDDVDVEYNAGVLTLVFPPAGTYVLNKQPPNKQIWLSSPISGPKRYDWVVVGEGQHEKEGGGSGSWVYARDGTTLGEVLRKEVGVVVETE